MSSPKIYTMCIGGAGGKVPASCTAVRIEIDNKVYFVIVDCGITIGKHEESNFNFPLDGSNIDAVLITHAHADHFLATPLLRKYKGKIYGTKETFVQGTELLYDGAYSNVRNAAEENGVSHEVFNSMINRIESIKRYMTKPEFYKEYADLTTEVSEIEATALYNEEDVNNIIPHFFAVNPFSDVTIAEGVHFRFIPNSHNNGAVSIELYVENEEGQIGVAFSGDIGPEDSLLYKTIPYEPNYKVQYAFIESTHGVDERFEYTDDAKHLILKLIKDAIKRNGPLIWVTPALEKSAQLVYLINQIIDEYNFSISVYLDAPLAYKQLKHYQEFYAQKKGFWFKDLGRNPFDSNELIVCRTRTDHISALDASGAKICIASRAFGDGGRVVDYFDKYVEDSSASFLITSWVPNYSPSGKLLNADSNTIVELNGKEYLKCCNAVQTHGLSSHGYFMEYEKFVKRFPKLKALNIVHGESEKQYQMKEKFNKTKSFNIFIPNMYNTVEPENSFFMMDCNKQESINSIDGFNLFKSIIKH